jgi:hypothetical protein
MPRIPEIENIKLRTTVRHQRPDLSTVRPSTYLGERHARLPVEGETPRIFPPSVPRQVLEDWESASAASWAAVGMWILQNQAGIPVYARHPGRTLTWQTNPTTATDNYYISETLTGSFIARHLTLYGATTVSGNLYFALNTASQLPTAFPQFTAGQEIFPNFPLPAYTAAPIFLITTVHLQLSLPLNAPISLKSEAISLYLRPTGPLAITQLLVSLTLEQEYP